MKNTMLAAASVAVSAAAFVQAAAAQTCTATLAQTEGPYYRSPNPETTFMRRGADGPLLRLAGRVVDTNCNPIPWTWVAVWHADPAGAYDNVAPFDVYRATYFTDANGAFAFDTIVPGLYPGRTKHIHVKVDAANTNLLTTQLYFPGVPQNASDGIYNAALEVTMSTLPDGTQQGYYQFVLPVAGACTGATITSSPARSPCSQAVRRTSWQPARAARPAPSAGTATASSSPTAGACRGRSPNRSPSRA